MLKNLRVITNWGRAGLIFNGCAWPGNDLIRSVSAGFALISVHVRVMNSVIRCDRIEYEVVCFDLMLRGLGRYNFICLDPSSFSAGRFGSSQVFVVLFDLICRDLVRFHSVTFRENISVCLFSQFV